MGQKGFWDYVYLYQPRGLKNTDWSNDRLHSDGTFIGDFHFPEMKE